MRKTLILFFVLLFITLQANINLNAHAIAFDDDIISFSKNTNDSLFLNNSIYSVENNLTYIRNVQQPGVFVFSRIVDLIKKIMTLYEDETEEDNVSLKNPSPNDEYTVVFIIDDNQTYEYSYKDGEKISFTPNAAVEGLHFIGWKLQNKYVNPIGYQVHEPLVFKATFGAARKQYQIEFDDLNGQVDHFTYLEGDEIFLVPTATKKGYQFTGWLLDGQRVEPKGYEVKANMRFVASYQKIEVDLKEQIKEAEEIKEDDTLELHIGEPIQQNDNVIALYQIKFQLGDNGSSNHFLIYHVKDGETLEYFPEVKANTGYKFLGWSMNGNDIVSIKDVIIHKNTTFYAVYVEGNTVEQSIKKFLGIGSDDGSIYVLPYVVIVIGIFLLLQYHYFKKKYHRRLKYEFKTIWK